jgi:hypothetical protein
MCEEGRQKIGAALLFKLSLLFLGVGCAHFGLFLSSNKSFTALLVLVAAV